MVELHSNKNQVIVELHSYKKGFKQKYLKNKHINVKNVFYERYGVLALYKFVNAI